jgi:hypothetical protein
MRRARRPRRGGDATVTEDDIIAGQMTIDFKTRTNLDSSGDLKEGSAAIGAQDKYMFNLSVAKTTEFSGDIVRQPKLYTKTLGRTKQNAKLAYNVSIAVLNPKDLKQKKNVGKWVGEVAIDPNSGAYNLGGGESPLRVAIDAVGRARRSPIASAVGSSARRRRRIPHQRDLQPHHRQQDGLDHRQEGRPDALRAARAGQGPGRGLSAHVRERPA